MVKLSLIQLPNPILTSPKMYFPLGILYLAAVVKKAGLSVKIVDMRDGIKEIPKAEYYGFSCTTPEIGYAKQLAKDVKGITILGGAHASLSPMDCKMDFNYTVMGEGEEVILDIIKGRYEEVKMGQIVQAGRIMNLDSIPYPAWDLVEEPFSDTLFPGERYGKGKKAATLIASRGCIFNCSFCGNMFRYPVVYRSIDNIIGEIKELKRRGINHYRFEDDNFTEHPQFSMLCGMLKKQNISYKCHTRSDLITEENAQLMEDSGCEECGLGVESADPKVLGKNHKRETISEHLKAVKIIKGAGMRVKTYFIAGLPGEDDATIDFNKLFFRLAKPDKWTVSTFTPYPGCAIYKFPDKFDIEIIDTDYNKWWNFCEDHFVHILKGQTPEQMWRRYKGFYDWLRKEEWRQ